MPFAILEEQEGRRHWVRSNSFTTAIRPPLAHLQYAEREEAERDAEIFRQENARQVEAAKRRRSKIEPASYTIVQV
jgi:hypothetical protein